MPVPGRHPANDLLQGFFLVLGFIGALALIVSGFLVVNTVSAILAQQTRQIGIMKAIGARNGQIAGLYLVLVLAYAVLALAVALPLGALGAYGFAQFTAGLANFDIVGVSIPPEVIALEVVIGLVVPLLAALVPIYRGVRITVREALASTGINDRFGSGRFDRLLRDIRGLPRPTLLSIRNTFRRKGRLLLTLAALGLGGAIFMSVFSVRASLVKTLDDTLAYFAYDVQVELATTERTSSSSTRRWRCRAWSRPSRGGSPRPGWSTPAGPRGRRWSRSACRPTRRPSGRWSRRDAGCCPTTATHWSRRRTSATTIRTWRSATRSRCGSTARTRRGRWSGSSSPPPGGRSSTPRTWRSSGRRARSGGPAC